MRLVILLAACALSACVAPDTPESCRITPEGEAPIRMVGAVPLVGLQVNGRPARFILDTGAESTVVRQSSADALGLEPDYRRSMYLTGIGAQTTTWAARPVVVSFAGVESNPTPLLVAAVPIRLPGNNRVDGLLGGDILSAYDLDIDIPARRIGLFRRRTCPNGPPPFAGESETLHATASRTGRLTLPVTLDGAALTLLVDTGASPTIVDQAAAGLTEADLSGEPSIHAVGADPVGLQSYSHRFKELVVGSQRVANPLLQVGSVHPPGIDGLLGTDVWRSRRLWISYGSRTVTIGPPQPRPR